MSLLPYLAGSNNFRKIHLIDVVFFGLFQCDGLIGSVSTGSVSICTHACVDFAFRL